MKYGIEITGEGHVLDDFSALFLVEHGYAKSAGSGRLMDTYVYELKEDYTDHIVLPFFESPKNQSNKAYSFLSINNKSLTIAGSNSSNPPYIYVYSTKKPIQPTRNSKYGIEIYNNKGGIVHSSNYRTLDVIASGTIGWNTNSNAMDLSSYNIHNKTIALTNVGNSVIYGAPTYLLECTINLMYRNNNSIGRVTSTKSISSRPPQSQIEANRLNKLLGVPTVSERGKAKLLVTVIDVTGIPKKG